MYIFDTFFSFKLRGEDCDRIVGMRSYNEVMDVEIVGDDNYIDLN